MILEHYSEHSCEPIKSHDQFDEPHAKPIGFWVSVKGEDDWPSWCRSEDFRVDTLSNCHRVTLKDDARVLKLNGFYEVEAFHDQYVDTDKPYPFNGYIRWADVARDYQGIIIAPYQWGHRLDGPCSRWYYGWDCASGCIWDANAIASVDVLHAVS